MRILKILYLVIRRKPYKTQYTARSNNFIIKKKDKNYEKNKEYIKCIEQIKKYGSVLDPVVVTKEEYSNKYIIRKNSSGYYALLNSHMHNIPIMITNL